MAFDGLYHHLVVVVGHFSTLFGAALSHVGTLDVGFLDCSCVNPAVTWKFSRSIICLV